MAMYRGKRARKHAKINEAAAGLALSIIIFTGKFMLPGVKKEKQHAKINEVAAGLTRPAPPIDNNNKI